MDQIFLAFSEYLNFNKFMWFFKDGQGGGFNKNLEQKPKTVLGYFKQ